MRAVSTNHHEEENPMNAKTKKNAMVHSALLVALSLAGAQAVNAAGSKASEIPAGWEPCAGVAKAGMNDCASKLHACAGLSKIDNEADSYVYMPKGLCEKIAKGTVLSKEDVKKMMEMQKKM